MSAPVRLPEIWWTCACVTCDQHDNEVTTYIDVVASTKSEALERAEARVAGMGLAFVSGQALACPERPLALPAPQIPPQQAQKEEPKVEAPFFEYAYFTKYADTTRIAAEGGK